ncbi:MAG: guanylate kinase [Desulfosarcinaceae bacterium]|nr:guanylate kinase [Desulfosarcinaceae bacterium]
MAPTPTPDPPSAHLFILSAPSGAGKSTLGAALRRRFPQLGYSVSFTTRRPRGGEHNGVDYHFIDAAAFEAGITSGRWAEWAQVHGHYYGTSAEILQRYLTQGTSVLMDIDVQGAAQIVARFPAAVTIFIMPPSLAVLRQRLEGRGTDNPDVIATRMRNAASEMMAKDRYRHVIINDDLRKASAELIYLVDGYLRGEGG